MMHLAAAFLAVVATAAPEDPDARGVSDANSRYTLLNPTPRELRRPMSTDRPDATESPYTVDAGAVQVELSFVEYTRDRERGERTETYAVAPVNLKIGVLNDADLHLIFSPYVRIDGPGGERADGFGDVTVRFRMNLWGNDGGETALALMPFITLPAATGGVGAGRIEGGLIVPFAVDLPHEWSLGLMAELDIVGDGDGGTTAELVHTAVLGRSIVGDLGGFVEYIGVTPLENRGRYRASLATGLTYAVSADVQLDAGVVFGLTERPTDDFTIFAGLSVRF